METNFIQPDTPPSLEKEPRLLATIYFVRHGATNYEEYNMEKKEIARDLTEQGEKDIEIASEKIFSHINRNLPIRVISSPRLRARHSADIFMEKARERQINLSSPEYKVGHFVEGSKVDGDAAEIWSDLISKYGTDLDRLWRKGEVSAPGQIETNSELFERIKTDFERSVKIIRSNSIKNKRDLSQIVLFSHGEVIESLISAYGLRPFYDPDRKFKTGEVGEIKVFENTVIIKYDSFEYEINI